MTMLSLLLASEERSVSRAATSLAVFHQKRNSSLCGERISRGPLLWWAMASTILQRSRRLMSASRCATAHKHRIMSRTFVSRPQVCVHSRGFSKALAHRWVRSRSISLYQWRTTRSGVLAFAGLVNPLVAAILMPLSGLTVLVLALQLPSFELPLRAEGKR